MKAFAVASIVTPICAVLCTSGTVAMAQNSSLLHQPLPIESMARRSAEPAANLTAAPIAASQYGQQGDGERPPIMLDGASWTYRPDPPTRVFQKNDVITIRVDEITRVLADGSAISRKRTLYEAVLSDWIHLTDGRLRPDPQDNGDPTIAGLSNAQYRAQSSIQSRESMAFNIAATVVDIRPNGGLVLEARKTIQVNDNLWETSLSGICRATDIGPDNVVLSKDLIELEIQKQDRGHLRDGYKRGWFARWLDNVQPF